MALLESNDTPLGTEAPGFELPDTVSGETVALDDLVEDVVVVMFICNHCPYVKAVADRLAALGRDYGEEVDFIAISSNDAERYPADAPDKMAETAEEWGFTFPYLYDETQQVAKAHGAVCTPDIFVYDDERKLAYRGRIDDNWKDPSAVTRRDLRAALDALLAGERPAPDQHPSMGCSIKWKY